LLTDTSGLFFFIFSWTLFLQALLKSSLATTTANLGGLSALSAQHDSILTQAAAHHGSTSDASSQGLTQELASLTSSVEEQCTNQLAPCITTSAAEVNKNAM
jgi:hypothetical protein